MQVNVKFLGSYKEMAGTGALSIPLADGATVAELLQALCDKFENLPLSAERSIVIVNQRTAWPETPLHDGDEAFVMQVIGGGSS